MNSKTVVFVVNNPSYYVSHRMSIGIRLLEEGYSVHIIAPGACPVELKEHSFTYHEMAMSRKGKNPFLEILTVHVLYRLFRLIKPDLVHLVTIKPYLYGGIAARLAGVPSVVSVVAGLGILFSQNTLKAKVLRAFLYPMYRLAFGHKNQTAIFQNTNDRDLLIDWGVLNRKKAVLIRGAGADLQQYQFCEEPTGVPIISFAARLLIDKGVFEFVESSRLLQQRGIAAEFWLIGDPDPGNANTVTGEQLITWESEGLVTCLGHRSDIPDLFAQSNIVSLPSFYGEGLPKVLIEAAACGRAVVTTDHPGCRDAIESGETGILVPIKDAVALADAFEYLIQNPDARKTMGQAGRDLAEQEFAIEKIVDAHLVIYQNLLNKKH